MGPIQIKIPISVKITSPSAILLSILKLFECATPGGAAGRMIFYREGVYSRGAIVVAAWFFASSKK